MQRTYSLSRLLRRSISLRGRHSTSSPLTSDPGLPSLDTSNSNNNRTINTNNSGSSSSRIHHTAFPHIFARILSHASRDTLLACRLASRATKRAADAVLLRHLRLVQTDTLACLAPFGAPSGRIPLSPDWRPFLSCYGLGASVPPEREQATAGSGSRLQLQLQFRRRRPLLPPPLVPSSVQALAPGTLSYTEILDLGTPGSLSPLATALLEAATSLRMVRFVPATALPSATTGHSYCPSPALPPGFGLTVVHFWMERTCLLPSFLYALQERITKVVFTVRHYRPVPERLRWYETYNARYPNVQHVVFLFGSNADGGPLWITDPSYFHREHRGDVRPRPCMFTALVQQVARILLCTRTVATPAPAPAPNGTPTTGTPAPTPSPTPPVKVTLVGLRDVPHPRFLGVSIPGPFDSTSGARLEALFLEHVEKEIAATALALGTAAEGRAMNAYRACVEAVSMDEYRARTGETFGLEVNV